MGLTRWSLAACVVCVTTGGAALLAAMPQAPARAPTVAAGSVDRASVDAALAEAQALLRAQRGAEARPLFERVAAAASRLALPEQEGQALIGFGEVLYHAAQYAEARQRGLQALAIFERLGADAGLGRARHLLSIAEDMLGDKAAAREHSEQAVAAFDRAQLRAERASAALQLLRVTSRPLAEQRPIYDRVIDDARVLRDARLEGRALHSLGDHLFTAGEYDEALLFLTRAAAVLDPATDAVQLGTVNNSLGRVYRAHGRLDEALSFQRKALALHEKSGAPFETLQSLNAVAVIEQRLGDLNAARMHYERALAMAQKSSSVRVQDLVRANLASLLLDQGQFANGARVLEEVIANGLDQFKGRRFEQLSYAYSKLARPQDALVAAGKAVDECASGEDVCVDALSRRASVQAGLRQMDAALTDVNDALARIESVRARLVPTDFFRQDYPRAQEGIYSQAIALQVQARQGRAALETAELARSRAFIDLLAGRDVRLKDKDQAQLASLRDGVSRTAPRVALAGDTTRALPLVLRGAGGTATHEAGTATPSVRELRSFVAAEPSAALDLAAAAARMQSTLVAYWVGEDAVFIWVVTPDGGVQTRRVPVLRSRLMALVAATSPFAQTGAATSGAARRVTTRGADTVSLQAPRPTAWRELYGLLIAPVRTVLPTTTGALLTVVPQGPLLNLSFAALQNANGRYLLEDYTLHYVPAGAVLQYTEPKRRADARTGSMLVLADPALPKLSALDKPLPRLPGARSEAAAIARLVPATRLTVLQGGDATEATVRGAVQGRAVLHFATHAIVRDEDPFGSFLALGPTAGGGTGSDGLLTSEEVYALDLNADLVVLSACQSAGGRVTGDGISSFARAFIYAGTASLVASLWDVADEPTNRLLPDFYRAWLGGESKGRALRNAQLRLLRDLRAGRVRIDTPAGVVGIPEHPVFWAGFALFGEPD